MALDGNNERYANYLTLFPVKQIVISDHEIVITRSSRQYRYEWSDITEAKIVKRESFKPYGADTGAEFIQKLFVIKANDQTFKFDISSSFPDFKHNAILVNELKKRLNVNEGRLTKREKSREALWWVLLIVTASSVLAWSYGLFDS